MKLSKRSNLIKKATLEIIPESHLDHGIPKNVVDFILNSFKDKNEFFIETIDVPDSIPCGLYGPIMGDPPIKEEDVFYAKRGSRPNESRLIDKPIRNINKVTVIAGPHGDKPCVLYTAFGGPLAPQEPGDPNVKNLSESEDFWSQHALAAEGISPKEENPEPEKQEELKTSSFKRLSKRAFEIDPLEDPYHPDYEKEIEKEQNVFQELKKYLPSRHGKILYVCPTCEKSFKAESVDIDKLNEWSFKNGTSIQFSTKGCPNCDPMNYNPDKDPNIQLPESLETNPEKEVSNKDINFKWEFEPTDIEDIKFSDDKEAGRKNKLSKRSALNLNIHDGFLIEAVRDNDIEEVIFNLKQGANPNVVVQLGGKLNSYSTLLEYSIIQMVDDKIIEALVNAGANINTQDKRNGWSPLHWALIMGKSPFIILLLIKNHADLTLKDNMGNTPLDLAIKSGSKLMISFLLNATTHKPSAYQDVEGERPIKSTKPLDLSMFEEDIERKIVDRKTNELLKDKFKLNAKHNMKLSKRAEENDKKDDIIIEEPEELNTDALVDSILAPIKDTKQGVLSFPEGPYNIKEWDGTPDVVYLKPIATENFVGYRMTYPDGVTYEIPEGEARNLVVSPLETVEAELKTLLKVEKNKLSKYAKKLSNRA